MKKIQVVLFIAGILSELHGHPLQQNEDKSSEESHNDTKEHDSKVKTPFISGQTNTQLGTTNEPDSKASNERTDRTYIEQTYIEVLVPGVPKVNTTVLESLLNSSANNNHTENARSKRSSIDNTEEISDLENSDEDKPGDSSSSSANKSETKLNIQNDPSENRRHYSRPSNSNIATTTVEKNEPTKNVKSEDEEVPSSSSTATPPQFHIRGAQSRPVRGSLLKNDESSSSPSSENTDSDQRASLTNVVTPISSTHTASAHPGDIQSRPLRDTAIDKQDNFASKNSSSSTYEASHGSTISPASHSSNIVPNLNIKDGSSSLNDDNKQHRVSAAAHQLPSSFQSSNNRVLRDSIKETGQKSNSSSPESSVENSSSNTHFLSTGVASPHSQNSDSRLVRDTSSERNQQPPSELLRPHQVVADSVNRYSTLNSTPNTSGRKEEEDTSFLKSGGSSTEKVLFVTPLGQDKELQS